MDTQLQLKDIGRDRWMWTGICFVLATLAILSPAWPGSSIAHYLGELLVWASLIEIYDGFRRTIPASRTSARWSGALSLLMAVILLNQMLLQSKALYVFIALLFAVDAVRYAWNFFRTDKGTLQHRIYFFGGIGNLVLVGSMFFWESKGQALVFSLATGLRLAGIGISLLLASVGKVAQVDEDVTGKIGLKGDPYVSKIAERVKAAEEASAIYDRRWIITFIILLFVIHLGRMGLDRSFLGILSPLVATLGDVVIALIVTYAVLAPLRLILLKLMRRRAQRLWGWISKVEESQRRWFSLRNVAAWWLSARIHAEVRFIKAGYSMPTAIRIGLKTGLPWAALLVAIMPVLGMSWYFDTENWASGIWDKWAAKRADVWRMAMIDSSDEGVKSTAFKMHPPSVNSEEPFSFVVIGDPGEGDASQLVLKDRIIEVSDQPDVRFVVISSDVVYPTGALRDYEKKFWMPFKGVKKPVYAIPGNHDWYDALDGFAATFFEPEAARRAMKARAQADLKLTSTTESAIDESITLSDRWRKEYEVPTGFQKAPFFQVSTDNFVLITLETGVERQIDSLQHRWLVNVLEASKGKFVMIVLGHPFYAIGEYQGSLNPKFESLHALLRSYHVPLVMAGDTHDLEYYREEFGENETMHHFVNGGGGAYLSIGTAMTPPEKMPTKEYAYYPSRDPLVKKIEENTKWYKRPAWLWTTALNGWPFSAEWLSAMFDYNVSPYFQSFMKISVDPSGRVTLVPYGIHGRLRWSDMTSTSGARPQGAKADDFVEWVVAWNK